MIAPIKEPIIVVCDEVLVFETLSHATTYIEPWDTEDCDAAYDSEGRLLRVVATTALLERKSNASPKTRSWLPAIVRRFMQQPMESQLAGLKLTKIEAVETEPTHQPQLEEVLVDWLARIYVRRDVPVSRKQLSRESLEQLVRRAMEYSTR